MTERYTSSILSGLRPVPGTMLFGSKGCLAASPTQTPIARGWEPTTSTSRSTRRRWR
jgi:hypothetical protein